MKYKSICIICGQQTPECENITEHSYLKAKLGFIEVGLKYGDLNVSYNFALRSLNFCPSCSKKSYTIEELKTIGNYNQWSY
jgi:hypothetical protein